MIEGVKTLQLIKNMDDRGFFMEVLRDDEGLLKRFGQFSQSITSPGKIKAFHLHKTLDDLWSIPVGNAQIVLHDVRDNSPTKGQTNVFYIGERNSILLYIPIGVAHGYRVLGNHPAILTYYTAETKRDDSPDESWIPWNDPRIGFDWEANARCFPMTESN